MFRNAFNFDKLLDKATSQMQLGPDWVTILQICDLIRQNAVQPIVALVAIKKKVLNPNPHVAYYALLVLESCVKNCGTAFHDEVGTVQFMEHMRELVMTSQHENVRLKVLELIETWVRALRNIRAGTSGTPGTHGTNIPSGSPEPRSTSGICSPEGFYPNPQDFTKFYRCVGEGSNFNKYEFQCGPGTAWDQNIQSCNHQYLVPSCNRQQDPQATNRPSNEPSGTWTNQRGSTRPTTYLPSPPAGSQCSGDGFFANPNDCRKFYRCVNGQRFDFDCAPGTAWDQALQTCNHINLVPSCGTVSNGIDQGPAPVTDLTPPSSSGTTRPTEKPEDSKSNRPATVSTGPTEQMQESGNSTTESSSTESSSTESFSTEFSSTESSLTGSSLTEPSSEASTSEGSIFDCTTKKSNNTSLQSRRLLSLPNEMRQVLLMRR